MGCGFSKGEGGGDGVVSLCRERIHLMRMAVKQRRDFADSHSKYIHSLSSVSSATRLLVPSYTNPSSSPSPHPPLNSDCPCSPASQTALSTSALEAIPPFHPSVPVDVSETGNAGRENGEEEEEEGDFGVCGFFYGDKPPSPMPSQKRVTGWDLCSLFNGSSFETMCLMREKDGETQLEYEEDLSGAEGGKRKSSLMRKWDGNGGIGNGVEGASDEEEKENGRALLDALKDVEDRFARVYEYGFNVSRMLEVNKVLHPQAEENPINLIDLTPRHPSISARSSPCKSLLSSYGSYTSSTLTECISDPFDGCGTGMQPGSHLFTLGRLYAWEKKLFKQVKAGDKHRKSYEKKYELLMMHNIEGEDKVCSAKTRAEIASLHTKVMVARRSAESIYKQIEKLRDEDLQLQILELLHGLMRTWKMMFESHEIQARVMRKVKLFLSSSDAYGKYCNDSHRLATLELEAVLQTWHACFIEYMANQKAYIRTLHECLSKFVDVSELHSSHQLGSQTLLATCQKWLDGLETLPLQAVEKAMKILAKDVRALLVLQGEEQLQKRNVDELAKEIERRAVSLQKQEHKFAVTKDLSPRVVRNQVGYLSDKKDLMDQLRKKLDLEKVKYRDSMVETRMVALNVLAKQLSCVFESLADFSKDSVKLYAGLLGFCENGDREIKDPLSGD